MVVPEMRSDTNFRRRLRRRLYYGDMANMDTPSLPLTELAVDYFHDSAPHKLGHVDLENASNIVRENNVTPCSMVVSVLYARRLRQRSKQYLETMSSSDVFFISMMMASKYMYDEGTDDEVYNDEWAVSLDQEVADVNKMEMDFLQAMDWRLLVRPEEFEHALEAIEKRLALQEGLKRGWFTYAELDVLMGADMIGNLWSCVGAECSKLVASLSAAYLTGLLSMLSSVVLASQVSGPLSSVAVALITLHSSLHSTGAPIGDSLLAIPSLNRHSREPGRLGLRDGVLSHGESVLALDAINETDLLEEVDKRQDEALYQGAKVAEGVRLYRDGRPYGEESRLDSHGTEGGGGGTEGRDEDRERSEEEMPCREDRAYGEKEGEGRGGRPGGEEESSTRCVTSSLWSLWFVDSLLSQVLALPSFKSRAAPRPSHHNSSFGDGLNGENNTQEVFVSMESGGDFSKLGQAGSLSFRDGTAYASRRASGCSTCLSTKNIDGVRATHEHRRSRRGKNWHKHKRLCSHTQAKLAGRDNRLSAGDKTSPQRQPAATPASYLSLLSSLLAWLGSKASPCTENGQHGKCQRLGQDSSVSCARTVDDGESSDSTNSQHQTEAHRCPGLDCPNCCHCCKTQRSRVGPCSCDCAKSRNPFCDTRSNPLDNSVRSSLTCNQGLGLLPTPENGTRSNESWLTLPADDDSDDLRSVPAPPPRFPDSSKDEPTPTTTKHARIEPPFPHKGSVNVDPCTNQACVHHHQTLGGAGEHSHVKGHQIVGERSHDSGVIGHVYHPSSHPPAALDVEARLSLFGSPSPLPRGPEDSTSCLMGSVYSALTL